MAPAPKPGALRGRRLEHIGEDLMPFDPDETVTLYNQGLMTLRMAVERVMQQKLQGPQALILRDGKPPILNLIQIKVLAADWDIS
jgi:hypothetical protein